MLPYDDVDDVFDEDTGVAPTDEAADETARGAREMETREEGFLSPELGEYLKAFAAMRGREGGGDEEGREDESGAGKRKGAASEMEREGEAGERAGKKKKRRGGSQKREYKNREVKRGERGSQKEAPR